MRNFFYVPFFCLLWMHQAFAQIQPEIKVVNSPSNLAKVQPIDWDNDGDSDLLIFDNQDTAYSKLSWLEHLSNGLLSSLQPLDSIHAPANTLYWVSSNDFNNDGRLDYIFYNNLCTYYIRFQNPAGDFIQQIVLENACIALSFYDLDNDGDIDMIGNNTDLQWYKNDGLGNFSPPILIDSGLSSFQPLLLEDINEDGWADIIQIDGQFLYIYRGLGNGLFSVKQSYPLNLLNFAGVGPTVVSGDMDGDGYPDLVMNGNPYWMHNDGQGGFDAPQLIDSTNTFKYPNDLMEIMVTTDWDGDGDTDILGQTNITDSTDFYFIENIGLGQFQVKRTHRGFKSMKIVKMFNGDWNGDGKPDIISSNRVFIKQGVFPDTPVAPMEYLFPELNLISDASPADLDGDGDLDFAVSSSGDHKISWYPNLGNDAFGPQRVISIINYGAPFMRTGDFDNDGDIDILSGVSIEINGFWRLVWYENDGLGNFSNAPNFLFDSSSLFSRPPEVFDLDSDNRLDIVGIIGTNAVWSKNLGAGNFGPPNTITSIIDSYQNLFEMADIDRDGDLDFISFAKDQNFNFNLSLFKNSGLGNFYLSDQFDIAPPNGSFRKPLVGDLDGDGDLDLTTNSYSKWIENIGDQGFSSPHLLAPPPLQYPHLWLFQKLTDMDNDGDADLLVTNNDVGRWYPNLGHGELGDFIPIVKDLYPGYFENPKPCKFADMDGSGLLDPIFITGNKVIYIKNIGDFPLIRGACYLDENENGIKDSLEHWLPSIKLHLDQEPWTTLSNQEGSYRFYVDTGNYVLTFLPDSCWALSSDSALFHINVNGSPLLPYLFGFKKVMDNMHLVTQLVYDPLVCFQNKRFYLSITNLGCNPAEGTYKLFTGGHISLIPAGSVPPIELTADSITWKFDTLLPGSTRTIIAYFNIGALAPGDTLHLLGVVEAHATDGSLKEQVDSLKRNAILLCSYDPNDKSVDRTEIPNVYIPNENTLIYTIRFQNTGNYKASNIRVRDTLDASLNWNTLRPLSGSHRFETTIDLANGAIEFLFPNICLPDSTANEPESHGYVSYEILPKSDLTSGTVISNTASIYFDFNLPILTNTTETQILMSSGTSDSPNQATGISFYPNPTTGVLAAAWRKPTNENGVFQVFDVLGKLVYSEPIPTNALAFTGSISGLPSGLYYVKMIVGRKEFGVSKLIKI